MPDGLSRERERERERDGERLNIVNVSINAHRGTRMKLKKDYQDYSFTISEILKHRPYGDPTSNDPHQHPVISGSPDDVKCLICLMGYAGDGSSSESTRDSDTHPKTP